MAITYGLDVGSVLAELKGMAKKGQAILKGTVKSTAAKSRKLAKTLTPKASGLKGRGKKAGGIKRLSQSLEIVAYQKAGKFRAVVQWGGGRRGYAGYANYLNYGAKNYTRRKIRVRKDGKPPSGKLPRVGMKNTHNSRAGTRKTWANHAWARIKPQAEMDFIGEARKRIDKEIARRTKGANPA